MHAPDEDKTSFITNRGLYCYKVRSFKLKNARATYQWLVNWLFNEQNHGCLHQRDVDQAREHTRPCSSPEADFWCITKAANEAKSREIHLRSVDRKISSLYGTLARCQSQPKEDQSNCWDVITTYHKEISKLGWPRGCTEPICIQVHRWLFPFFLAIKRAKGSQ